MAEATVENNVKIEDAGPARKRLTITVPVDAIDEKIESSIMGLATEASLPGFRKGRAPKHLLERRFGPRVREESKNQLIAEAYAAAIEEAGLKALGDPEPVDPDEETKLEPGKPLTFAVHIEVLPEFELPELSELEIQKPMLEIGEDLIEGELNQQRMKHGTPTSINEDFRPGDRLLGYATVTKDGEDEPFFRTDQAVVTMPSADDDGRGQMLGLLIDDLAKVLKGKKVGDNVTLTTKGPEQHEREDLRGADLTIQYEIRAAQHLELADLETVCTAYEIPNEEILREQVKMALEQRRDEEQAAAMREQVCDHLGAAVDFELPEKITAAQAQRALDRYRLELLYRGVPEDSVEQKVAEARAESEIRSRERLKLSFILHKLADQYAVQVSDQEINGRIAAIAAQRGTRPEQLRAELVQSGQINQIASQIRENKAADQVVKQAKLTEVSADEWRAIIEKKNEAAGESAGSSKKKTTKKKTTKKKTSKKTPDKGASS